MGPVPVAAAVIPAAGQTLGTAAVSGASVTVGGHPAPVLYVSSASVGFVVPYEISGFPTADIVVTYQGQALPTLTTPVAFTAPGVFTQGRNGAGPATALNQDGTLNTATNPAAKGSVVYLFATGDGPKNPPGQDGFVTSDILREPMFPVTATIGGQPATVLYAGTTPGFVEGVTLVEAVIPSGAASGAAPVVLTANGVSSLNTATIAVK
jgi:uncharacterized protein (TIGR03437 family)